MIVHLKKFVIKEVVSMLVALVIVEAMLSVRLAVIQLLVNVYPDSREILKLHVHYVSKK